MPFEIAAKKAGLNLVRTFLHSVQGVIPGMPEAVRTRTVVGYKVKKYQDGKMIQSRTVETYEDGFPCKGDLK